MIVGTGRLGAALSVGLHALRPQQLSGRELLAKREVASALGEVRCVIHASGPAGEQACREDPGLAFALHYTLTERLLEWAVAEGRRVILLGTVAPLVGFYGPLKRAAVERAFTLVPGDVATAERVTVVECGHVVGEGLPIRDRNAGVVARFVAGALTGQALPLAGSGAQRLRYTPVSTLVQLLAQVVRQAPKVPTLSPVSEPVTVMDVARMTIRLADLLHGVNRATMVPAQAVSQPDYIDPTGQLYPVPALHDVLVPWMRTIEAKILLGVR